MKLTINEAELLAKKFRVENELSLKEPISLRSLLRKLNILTIFRPLSESFHGMALKSHNGIMAILVNSNNNRGRQRFTIAHELYHLFYDSNPKPHICRDGDQDISEVNANTFASSLLLPEDGLIELIPVSELKNKEISLGTIIKIEQYYSTSRAALLYRLKALKYITKTQNDLFHSMGAIDTAARYGYDTSLYKPANKGLFISDYAEMAIQIYEQGKISEGHYNELRSIIPNGKNKNSIRRRCYNSLLQRRPPFSIAKNIPKL